MIKKNFIIVILILIILLFAIGSTINLDFNSLNSSNINVIKFEDINLYNAVKEQLYTIPLNIGYDSKIDSFNDEEKTITIFKDKLIEIEYLDLFEKNITNLQGIENFPNLNTVYIDFLTYKNLSDRSLLDNIENVNFSDSQISENIIYFTDNITNGISVANVISKYNNMKYIESGIDGITFENIGDNQTICNVFNSFKLQISEDENSQTVYLNSNYIILQIGTNDILRASKSVENNEKTKENIIKDLEDEDITDSNTFSGGLFQLLLSIQDTEFLNEAKIIVVGTPRIIEQTEIQEAYIEKIKAICEEKQVTYIDLYDELDLTNEENSRKYTIGDGYHLNELGINEFLFPKIQENLMYNNYYISSDGISQNGKIESIPMSIDIATSKTYQQKDRILFKRGDTIYGNFKLNVSEELSDDNSNLIKITNYGDKNLPEPIITASKSTAITSAQDYWTYEEESKCYKIDLKKLQGYSTNTQNVHETFYNIGFIETEKKGKLYNVKTSKEKLVNEGDFFVEYTFFNEWNGYGYKKTLYLKTENGGENISPTEIFGDMIFAGNVSILNTERNVEIYGLNLKYSGASGIEGFHYNVYIHDVVIDETGGSLIKHQRKKEIEGEDYEGEYYYRVRYGNSIGMNSAVSQNGNIIYEGVNNVIVSNNILRNTYDVGFTVQGRNGKFENIEVINNIFIGNTQDCEIYVNSNSDLVSKVDNFIYENNISIEQGRGWGYYARPNKINAASILFHWYEPNYIGMRVSNNITFNPRRMYYSFYVLDENNEKKNNVFGYEQGKLISEENKIYTSDLAMIMSYGYRHDSNAFEMDNLDSNIQYLFTEFKDVSEEFNIEKNSTIYIINETRTDSLYNELEEVPIDTTENKYSVYDVAFTSNDYDEIKNALMSDIKEWGVPEIKTKNFDETELGNRITNKDVLIEIKTDNDVIYTYQYSLDNGVTWLEYNKETKLVFDSDGEFNIIAKSLNNKGTESDISSKISFIIDKTVPQATINYTTTEETTGSVIATITFDEEDITITNNEGENTYTFLENGEFTFEYVDKAGNKGEAIAKVENILKSNLTDNINQTNIPASTDNQNNTQSNILVDNTNNSISSESQEEIEDFNVEESLNKLIESRVISVKKLIDMITDTKLINMELGNINSLIFGHIVVIILIVVLIILLIVLVAIMLCIKHKKDKNIKLDKIIEQIAKEMEILK